MEKEFGLLIMSIIPITIMTGLALILVDWLDKLRTLHKTGTLITKKGVYTFRHG